MRKKPIKGVKFVLIQTQQAIIESIFDANFEKGKNTE